MRSQVVSTGRIGSGESATGGNRTGVMGNGNLLTAIGTGAVYRGLP